MDDQRVDQNTTGGVNVELPYAGFRAARGAHEPKFGPRIIKPIHASANECVRILWRMPDGSFFYEERTAPTPETVAARRKSYAEEQEKLKTL